VGHSRGSNRLKLYNGHGNVEATKALFAGCRGKQVKTFVPISLSIAIELSTTNITKLSNYVQSVQVLWSQPSSSLANESKFPEHSGKLKMLIKSCLSVVLTSTVYWLSNVSAKMGCSLGRNREGGRITYLATNTRTQQPVVIKRFLFTLAGASWTGFKAYEREIQVLKGLNHPGIPRYLNCFDVLSGFCMVQEYKDAQPLSVPRTFDSDEVKQIAVSILEILVYLQNRIP
jgi:hypothetical protein